MSEAEVLTNGAVEQSTKVIERAYKKEADWGSAKQLKNTIVFCIYIVFLN